MVFVNASDLKSLHFKWSNLNVLQAIFGSNKNEIVSMNKYEEFCLHACGVSVDGVYSSWFYLVLPQLAYGT